MAVKQRGGSQTVTRRNPLGKIQMIVAESRKGCGIDGLGEQTQRVVESRA